mmetsp:Transcript_18673/g.43732  ORF Transcript_18673/g.43732 Transcript_18673/m.43732 type:complete len:420 (-) Transcript_18673:152-1411(-)
MSAETLPVATRVRGTLREDPLVTVRVENIVEQDLEVLRRDVLKVGHGALPAVLPLDGEPVERPDGRVHPRPVHGVPDRACVREVRQLHPGLDVLLEDLVGRRLDVVLEVAAHDVRDLHELVGRVVREVDVVSDPAHHPRDVGEERVHPVLVPGHGDDEVVLVVLHDVEEDLDGLLPVVAVVGRVVEVVRLVDEEDASHGLLDHLLGLGGGVPDVLSHEVVAGGQDDVSPAGVAHLGQDLPHAHGHGRLSGPGGSGERHVEARHARLEAELPPHLVQHEERRDLLHPLLDGDEPDQVPVELVELILHPLLEHELVHGPRRLVVGHLVHVRDLRHLLLPPDLGRALPPVGLLLDLAALDVGVVQLVAQPSRASRGRVLAAELEGLALSERGRVGPVEQRRRGGRIPGGGGEGRGRPEEEER